MQCRHLLVASVLALASGCVDDAGGESAARGETRGLLDAMVPADAGVDGQPAALDAGDGGALPVASAVAQGALYVVASWISTTDTVFTYVRTVSELASDSKLDVKADALEVPGYGDAKVVGNKLYVSGYDEPTVTRYSISTDGRFSKEQTLDFSAYARAANLFEMTFLSPTVAYFVADASWVRWNPSTMRIDPDRSIPFPASIVPRDGIAPYYAFDRGFAVRGKYLFHAISWFDLQEYKVTPSSLIAVIDTETNQLLELLDAPCPGLDTATTDGAGNIYYSGWASGPGAVYRNGGARACAVMIPAGSNTLSPDFKLSFAELTGHEAIGLRYLGGTKLIMQVFDEQRTPYEAVGASTSAWVYADSWYFATYDYVTREYKELKNLGYVGGGYYSELLGDRFFLLWRRDIETDYVQLLADGTAKQGITLDGWASRLYEVR